MTKNERPFSTYNEALTYLNTLINYERKPLDKDAASTLDLTRPQKLAELVGSPQQAYPAIHIAGTKGKGSVAAMTASCLRAAGLRVGLYTSPHLQDFRERIRVLTPDDADGRISEADFVAVVNELKTAVSHIPSATWFEVVTVMALLYFARQQVDIAVVETGLGGRFDATRVVNPLVCVITSISLDHTDLLGNTLAEIAFEKAGIMKPDVPVVIAPQRAEALSKLLDIAAERGSPLTAVSADWRYHGEREGSGQTLIIDHSPAPDFIPNQARFPMALDGDHQLQNGVVVLAALQTIQDQFPTLNGTAVRAGLGDVVWNGRLQTIHHAENSPTFLVDCAHNPDSIERLVAALQANYSYHRLILIFGAPSDKNVPAMLAQLVPLADLTITAAANHPRAADPTLLAQTVRELKGTAIIAASAADALTTAWENALPGDLICATGSIIFVGDLLNQWDSLKSRLL
ncbi:MAG: bifunctional folylpolyglutamate synthase/dihydrofolate synthase [Anaerolineae bacterium]|nr:bifunctional folylpolyglutamate synthase/dihydrofolate synthase [Anaerolineae bacterium]